MSTKNQQEQQEIVFGEEIKTDLFGDPLETFEEVKKEEVKVEKKKEDVESKEDKEKVKEEKVEEVVDEKNIIDFGDDDEEEKKVEKKETEKVKKEEDEIDYQALAEALVSSGQWKEFEIEGEDKKIDKETFENLLKEQTSLKETEAKEKVLSVLSNDEKEFLEFKKKGGDLESFVKTFDFKQKAENLDITTDQGKKGVIYSYYKNMIGWKDERIQKHLATIEKDLELDEEAEMAKSKIEEYGKNKHEEVKNQTAEAARLRKEAEDKYKEDVKSNLKEKGLDTKKSNIIIRDFTDRDEKGFTEVDKKYLELRNNPEKIDFLWSFLMDTDKFLEKISQKKVNEKELESFKKIKFNKKTKQNQHQEEEIEEGELIL